MAITLADHVHTAKLVKSGHDAAIDLSAGMILKIETSPDGEEVLNVECPSGKVWRAKVIVEITEMDV
jgi:ribosomal protein L2